MAELPAKAVEKHKQAFAKQKSGRPIETVVKANFDTANVKVMWAEEREQEADTPNDEEVADDAGSVDTVVRLIFGVHGQVPVSAYAVFVVYKATTKASPLGMTGFQYVFQREDPNLRLEDV
jgi:hypothetical protein